MGARHFIVGLALVSGHSIGFGAPADTFDCVMSWKTSEPGKSFAVTQRAVVVRTFLDYGRIRGHNVHMTSTSIPVAVKFGDVDYAATIEVRHATDVGPVGRATDAALWTCGELLVATPDAVARQMCEDKNLRSNPFADPAGRWMPASLQGNMAAFPRPFVVTRSMLVEESGEAAPAELRLSCTHLNTSEF